MPGCTPAPVQRGLLGWDQDVRSANAATTQLTCWLKRCVDTCAGSSLASDSMKLAEVLD